MAKKFYICKLERPFWKEFKTIAEFEILQLTKVQALWIADGNEIFHDIGNETYKVNGIINKPFDSYEEALVEFGIVENYYREKHTELFNEIKEKIEKGE